MKNEEALSPSRRVMYGSCKEIASCWELRGCGYRYAFGSLDVLGLNILPCTVRAYKPPVRVGRLTFDVRGGPLAGRPLDGGVRALGLQCGHD
jgi:hypothetical protein